MCRRRSYCPFAGGGGGSGGGCCVFSMDLCVDVERPRIATVGAAARADCNFGKNRALVG